VAPEVSDIGFQGALELSDDLREQLGLDAGESIHVLHTGSRTVLLERTKESGRSIALPWDRDLVLSAEVRSFPLADVLSMLHEAGKSGFLYFSRDDHEKCVYFHRGEVVFASSNQRVDRLGGYLLRAELITLEQLREAEKRFSPAERFGKGLVQRGVLSARELWDGVKFQVEEIVRSLFAYTAGTVHFWEGEVEPDNVVRLSLPTNRLVAEGLRRRDEIFRFLANLEDPCSRLVVAENGGAGLEGNEKSFFDAVQSEAFFPALCRSVGFDPLSGARTVQLLCLVGALRVERSEEPPEILAEPDSPAADEDTLRRCVFGYVQLLGELVAPMVAVEGPDPVCDRLQSMIEDTAGAFPELLGDLNAGPGAMLDPNELFSRAQRLSGDRHGAVAAAMGELVSYVEFELKNHAKLEDPDEFLAAVAELRASIET
jgi:hypothetical protein